MFDSPSRLILGLLTGIVFGFLLQKGKVAKYHVIVGQFLLRDWTVVKIMGTAVAVGSVGVHALVALGVTPLEIKPMQVSGVLFGAVMFGIGMAILGYCPGTALAAIGEGRRDAVAGTLGMLVGALIFVGGFPWIEPFGLAWDDFGKITLPLVTNTSAWLWIGAIALSALSAYAISRR